MIGNSIKFFNYFFTNILPKEYPLLLAFTLIPGSGILIWKARKYGYVFAIAFLCSLISVILVASNIMPETEFIIKQFLTYTYIFTAVFIAYCIYWIINIVKTRNKRIILIFVSLVTAVLLLYAKVPDYSRYFLCYDYAGNLVMNLSDGSLFFAEGDANILTALYMQNINKKNIYVIAVPLLNNYWYREQLKRDYGDKITITADTSNPVNDLKNLMYMNNTKGIYCSNMYFKNILSFPITPRGIVNEVMINGNKPLCNPLMYYRFYSFRGILDNNSEYDGFSNLYIRRYYDKCLEDFADGSENSNNIGQKLVLYERAFIFYKTDELAVKIGSLYIQKGDAVKSEGYLDEALRINPQYVPAYYYKAAVSYMLLKDPAETRKNLLKVLEFDKNNEVAKSLLNKLNSGT